MRRDRYQPQPLKLIGHAGIDAERLREQQEFEQRIKDAAEVRKAAAQWRRVEADRCRKAAQRAAQADKLLRKGRTPRFKIAKSFRSGHGKLS